MRGFCTCYRFRQCTLHVCIPRSLPHATGHRADLGERSDRLHGEQETLQDSTMMVAYSFKTHLGPVCEVIVAYLHACYVTYPLCWLACAMRSFKQAAVMPRRCASR